MSICEFSSPFTRSASSPSQLVPNFFFLYDRCIYFLNPDDIVPPSVTVPPAPRARANSFSHHQGGTEQEPVILEPPVTTNPLLYRPTLPKAEIHTIRRLSARVNVLPVIARADTLSNDRLAAVKLAVRRDLAEAGIGFGIFDVDNHHNYHHHHPEQHSTINGDSAPNGGYPSLTNGSGSSPSSSSPTTPSLLRLPYALISPDMYSHSEGIARIPLSRHELVRQYTPSPNNTSSKLIRGRFVRSYRWGSMDVLDPNHSDFMPLRNAIFHHMKVRFFFFCFVPKLFPISNLLHRRYKTTLGLIYWIDSKGNITGFSHRQPIILPYRGTSGHHKVEGEGCPGVRHFLPYVLSKLSMLLLLLLHRRIRPLTPRMRSTTDIRRSPWGTIYRSVAQAAAAVRVIISVRQRPPLWVVRALTQCPAFHRAKDLHQASVEFLQPLFFFPSLLPSIFSPLFSISIFSEVRFLRDESLCRVRLRNLICNQFFFSRQNHRSNGPRR
jgi:hypothetical protein